MFINTRPGAAAQMVVAQATPPANPTTGMIWIDTANNFFQYVRSGTSWISTPDYQVSTGSYEWNAANGNKFVTFSPFLTAVGREYEIDLLSFTVNSQLSPLNNSNNYWLYQLRVRPGNITNPGRLNLTEVVTDVSVWRQALQDLKGSILASGQFLSMNLSFVGNPGYTVFNASVTYRIRLL